MLHFKAFLMLAVILLTALSVEASDRIIAEVDGVPLRISSLCDEAKQLLAASGQSDDAKDIRLKAAVLLDIKMRITLKLLEAENIPVNADTVKWYIAERSRKYGRIAAFPENELSLLENDRKFQLKCAVFKYVFNKYPERVVLHEGEAESYYRRNQMRFITRTGGKYLMLDVPVEIHDSRRKAGDIRAVLLQGETPEKAAGRFAVRCRELSLPAALKFVPADAGENFVSEVFEYKSSWCVVKCVKAPGKSFIPFSVIEPVVEEELISRRAGAVFDEILKKELSLKSIKYRR